MNKVSETIIRDRNENEVYAISLAQILIDNFRVFDRCTISLALDEGGIDILLEKRMKKRYLFRFHVQHKSSKNGARSFIKYNPCIPVWIVNKSTPPHEALVSLLNMIVKKTSSESKPHYFFVEKLCEIKAFYQIRDF